MSVDFFELILTDAAAQAMKIVAHVFKPGAGLDAFFLETLCLVVFPAAYHAFVNSHLSFLLKQRGAIRTRLKLDLLPFLVVIVLDGRQPACVLCLDEGQNLFV